MKKGFKDLRVFQLSYQSAMEIFEVSKKFPRKETYSLTDQIRRSSRSVCVNLAEAYRKRRYSKHFVSKLTDVDAETSETTVWLDFARDCNYLDEKLYNDFTKKYEEIGKMIAGMIDNYEKFCS